MEIFGIKNENLFSLILGFSALFVAGIAAFFSVMGIGMLFSGATFSAILMASSLELGKLTATTFLYRYWNTAKSFLKVYLAIAILVLMGITSLGIFGWLSSAYQSSSLKYEISQQQISVMGEQKSQIQSQVFVSKQRIDDLMANRREQEKRNSDALNNEALLRNPTQLRQIQEQNNQLIRQTDVEINNEKTRYSKILSDSIEFDKKISDAKLETIKSKDVITFKFVADALGLDLTSTVKWFILAIILVFDPLAISLILAYNVAIAKLKEDEKSKSKLSNTTWEELSALEEKAMNPSTESSEEKKK
jgi:hypothetical protein